MERRVFQARRTARTKGEWTGCRPRGGVKKSEAGRSGWAFERQAKELGVGPL